MNILYKHIDKHRHIDTHTHIYIHAHTHTHTHICYICVYVFSVSKRFLSFSSGSVQAKLEQA